MTISAIGFLFRRPYRYKSINFNKKYSVNSNISPFQSKYERRAVTGRLKDGCSASSKRRNSKSERFNGNVPSNRRSPKGCVPQSNNSVHRRLSGRHALLACITVSPSSLSKTSRTKISSPFSAPFVKPKYTGSTEKSLPEARNASG